jgi:4'-phosphopantetheinyl transferase EntD
VTAAENPTNRAAVIDPPSGLPSFASFAVSPPATTVPAVAPDEEHLLSDAMVPARKEAFARGRAAAHAALRSLGLDHGPVLTGPGREPRWPAGASGSISHAAGFGIALVALTVYTDGVGVDLEQLRHAPELWDQVPRPEERTWLERLEPGEREAGVLALFSAKESVFKAFFPRSGSFFGFEMASLTPASSGFTGRLADGLDEDYPSQRSFTITCQWSGDIVLTSLLLPKTKIPFQAQQP